MAAIAQRPVERRDHGGQNAQQENSGHRRQHGTDPGGAEQECRHASEGEAEGEQCQGDGQPRKALHQKEAGDSGPDQHETKRRCLGSDPPRADGAPQTENQGKEHYQPAVVQLFDAERSAAEPIQQRGIDRGQYDAQGEHNQEVDGRIGVTGRLSWGLFFQIRWFLRSIADRG